MKNNTIGNRFSALALCFLLLFAAAPLPRAFAAPEDETGYTEDTGEDTGDSTDGTSDSSEGDGSNTAASQPGATNTDNVIAASADAPATNAEAALLVSPDSGMVLYEKNADERRYPASTTKIMTALIVLENVSDLSETVTAQASDFETLDTDSSVAGIKEGETVTIEDLLYGLMLPSGNEAAYILARHVAGSYDAFVDMMNQRAEELGCTGTHFSNPCGLHADDHYTTARDLYKIAYAAMQDETFADIASTVQWKMSKTNMQDERIIVTTNKLILSSYAEYAYPFCLGIKTGNTSQAGNCFVGYAEYGNSKLYSVVMGCDDRSLEFSSIPASFTDTRDLFKWGFSSFTSKTLATQGETLDSVDVRLSTDTDQLVLTVKNDLVALLPNNLEVSELEQTPTTPDSVDAPIKAGDVIGSMTYSYNGTVYGTVELVALNDVEMSRVLYYADLLSNFFQSTVFKVVLIVFAVFIVLYILFNLTFGGMRRRQQRKNMRTRYRNTNYQRRRRK